MLKRAEKEHFSRHFGATMLVIRGRRFTNTAAKFWSNLIDELCEDYTESRLITLEAAHDGALGPALLFPELELQREMDRTDFSAEGLRKAWRKALDDFEIYGPPGAVYLAVFSDFGETRRITLPMDCVDAEIFLYLLAWLLEWSDLPSGLWNEPQVKGAFSGIDPLRRFKYFLYFKIEHRPLKEGLFKWKLELHFGRNKIAESRKYLRVKTTAPLFQGKITEGER
ncbi:MAG: hypothetical protein PHP98_08645 [Kiritimatiellae bacterium]|nr:hypothetical protein [Kiritimatiellia bacterium]